jgi:alkane 1-monooxygenase
VWSVGLITGGIGITVAHELGHRLGRRERWVSRLLLGSVCYAHFQIEHNKGHHSKVATPDDPATARFGESFYAFWPRTVFGGLIGAWHIERDALKKAAKPWWSLNNQMWWVVVLPVSMALVLGVLFGWRGVVFFFVQSFVAFSLLELVNYVEHYGLLRQRYADGSYETITAAHSWNATQQVSNWLLFNLERHSHHHIHQSRPYQTLKHMEEAPQLPAGYSALTLVVLIPTLWRALMDQRTIDHRKTHGVPVPGT